MMQKKWQLIDFTQKIPGSDVEHWRVCAYGSQRQRLLSSPICPDTALLWADYPNLNLGPSECKFKDDLAYLTFYVEDMTKKLLVVIPIKELEELSK